MENFGHIKEVLVQLPPGHLPPLFLWQLPPLFLWRLPPHFFGQLPPGHLPPHYKKVKVVSCWKSLKVHLVTTHWRKAFCMLTMCWGTFWWKQLEDTHESLGKALPKFWSSTGFSTAERSPKGNSTREKHVCSMFRNKFYCEQHENAIEKLCWLTLAEKNYVPNMLYF